MKAAVIEEIGGAPSVQEFPEPESRDGVEVAAVRMAALNPIDQHFASGRYPGAPAPHVIGREGIAQLADGRRAYFSAQMFPQGSVAERAAIDTATVIAIPDDLGDGLALAAGAAGMTAWLALTYQAALQQGESVLVLGASGAVGGIAIQAARLLGAGRVVGAARDTAAVERIGATDAVVSLTDPDPAAALAAAAADGFDVVIDPLGGEFLAAAIGATCVGARLVNFGNNAGTTATVNLMQLLGRKLIGHSARFVPDEPKTAAFESVAEHLLKGDIKIDVEEFPLQDVGAAWERQAESPHGKVVVRP